MKGSLVPMKWIYSNNKKCVRIDQKSRVKLNNWYDWLVNHVPKTVKDRASRAFKAFKEKIIGLFKGGEDQTPAPALRPYQLKPKRGKEALIEPPVEQPPPDPKKLKRIKRKLSDLNRKIRHSKKKNDGLIHKRNSLRIAIKECCLWGPQGTRQAPIEHAQGFVECEQAFGGAYRSYRVNGRPKMDVDTFFSRLREGLIDLIK